MNFLQVLLELLGQSYLRWGNGAHFCSHGRWEVWIVNHALYLSWFILHCICCIHSQYKGHKSLLVKCVILVDSNNEVHCNQRCKQSKNKLKSYWVQCYNSLTCTLCSKPAMQYLQESDLIEWPWLICTSATLKVHFMFRVRMSLIGVRILRTNLPKDWNGEFRFYLVTHTTWLKIQNICQANHSGSL